MGYPKPIPPFNDSRRGGMRIFVAPSSVSVSIPAPEDDTSERCMEPELRLVIMNSPIAVPPCSSIDDGVAPRGTDVRCDLLGTSVDVDAPA